MGGGGWWWVRVGGAVGPRNPLDVKTRMVSSTRNQQDGLISLCHAKDVLTLVD